MRWIDNPARLSREEPGRQIDVPASSRPRVVPSLVRAPAEYGCRTSQGKLVFRRVCSTTTRSRERTFSRRPTPTVIVVSVCVPKRRLLPFGTERTDYRRLLHLYFTKDTQVWEDWLLWSEFSASAVFDTSLQPAMKHSFTTWLSWLAELVARGIQDGSILSDQEPDLIALETDCCCGRAGTSDGARVDRRTPSRVHS